MVGAPDAADGELRTELVDCRGRRAHRARRRGRRARPGRARHHRARVPPTPVPPTRVPPTRVPPTRVPPTRPIRARPRCRRTPPPRRRSPRGPRRRPWRPPRCSVPWSTPGSWRGSPTATGPETAELLAGGDYRYVVVTGAEPEVADTELLLPVIEAMAEDGPAPVVLASAVTGDDPEVREAVRERALAPRPRRRHPPRTACRRSTTSRSSPASPPSSARWTTWPRPIGATTAWARAGTRCCPRPEAGPRRCGLVDRGSSQPAGARERGRVAAVP